MFRQELRIYLTCDILVFVLTSETVEHPISSNCYRYGNYLNCHNYNYDVGLCKALECQDAFVVILCYHFDYCNIW